MTTHTPTGQDLVCLVCHKQAQDIDHVVNRGMGGSKKRDVPENKVPLCRECHELKTLGRIKTWVEKEGQEFHYFWQKADSDTFIHTPVEVSQRYKCLVKTEYQVGRLSDGAEEAKNMAHLGRGLSHASTPPSASSLKEESDGQLVRGMDSRHLHDDAARPTAALTHEQRVAIAAGIKEMEWGRQWLAGDTANEWEEELGEDFWNRYANEFGYTYPSLRNNQRVCKAIPKPLRHYELRFSHHVVVADLNREDMEMWLDKCVDESWSVAEFRRQVKGERPRVKRWTLEELVQLLSELRTSEVIHANSTPDDFLLAVKNVGEQG